MHHAFKHFVLFLLVLSPIGNLPAADTKCAARISVLYYPQYPERVSMAHTKLRVGSIVYSNNRDPGSYNGFVELTSKKRRYGFIEFPISYEDRHIRECHGLVVSGGTCSQATAFPLQKLGLLPERHLTLHSPTTMALYLYYRSRSLPDEYRPQMFGKPRILTGEGALMDLVTVASPITGPIGLSASIHLLSLEHPNPSLAEVAKTAGLTTVAAIFMSGPIISASYSVGAILARKKWNREFEERAMKSTKPPNPESSPAAD
jgi:hypothetical protein